MSYRANYAPDAPSLSSDNLFSFLTCLRTLTHYGRIALLTKNITMSWWTPQLNAVLGTVVVTIGGGLLWGSSGMVECHPVLRCLEFPAMERAHGLEQFGHGQLCFWESKV